MEDAETGEKRKAEDKVLKMKRFSTENVETTEKEE